MWLKAAVVVAGSCVLEPAGLSALDVVSLRQTAAAARALESSRRGAAALRDPYSHHDLREVVIRVSGGRIRALCSEGTPEVFILHADGSSADAWIPVLRRLDGSVGACVYDRRGTGDSRPAPEPRGWYELLDEMRRVHTALGGQGPYVLAGHGVGGLYARVYAADRPRDVAGLVLVEPAHADLLRRMRPGMPEDVWRSWTEKLGEVNRDGVMQRSVARRAERLATPRIPVTIVAATRRRDGDGWDQRFLNEAARQVHQSILQGLPGGRHVPAEGSGPEVQREAPGLVAAEIRRIVDAVRRRGM